MEPVWANLACPLCGLTLVASRAQFPEMAHADVVAMNFLQKAMEVHWNRFCSGGVKGGPAPLLRSDRADHPERAARGGERSERTDRPERSERADYLAN